MSNPALPWGLHSMPYLTKDSQVEELTRSDRSDTSSADMTQLEMRDTFLCSDSAPMHQGICVGVDGCPGLILHWIYFVLIENVTV